MPSVNVNGLKLNYLERGQGPPIVLSHGFQNSGFAFTPILDRLAERFRVFAVLRKTPSPFRPQRERADNRGEVHLALAERAPVYPRPNGAVSLAKVWAANLPTQEPPVLRKNSILVQACAWRITNSPPTGNFFIFKG